MATIGAFDGVHLGHQQLLRSLNEASNSLNLPAVVIVFEPQPNEYFQPERAPARLMRLREKVEAFSQYGLDSVVCLKFDRRLRALSAESFVIEVLVNGLKIQKLIVGDDFKFGSDRLGDYQLLKKMGLQYNFEVADTVTLKAGSQRISSTYLRSLLQQARLEEVHKLLGRHYQNIGRVIYGRQLGRTIGFPTMNVQLGRLQVPLRGVFAVELELDNKRYLAVANVGVRPTVNEVAKPLLEVHAINESLNAYGKFIKVIYRKKIRDELRFKNVEQLKKQIHQDVLDAKAYFAK